MAHTRTLGVTGLSPPASPKVSALAQKPVTRFQSIMNGACKYFRPVSELHLRPPSPLPLPLHLTLLACLVYSKTPASSLPLPLTLSRPLSFLCTFSPRDLCPLPRSPIFTLLHPRPLLLLLLLLSSFCFFFFCIFSFSLSHASAGYERIVLWECG